MQKMCQLRQFVVTPEEKIRSPRTIRMQNGQSHNAKNESISTVCYIKSRHGRLQTLRFGEVVL